MAASRADALAILDEGAQAINALIARLSDEQLARPATIGGGDWSAADLLAHLAFWEELAAEAAGDWRAGRVPRVEEAFRQRSVDDLNAENQARSSGRPLAEVRRRAEAAHAEVTALVRDLSDEEWAEKAPYPTERRQDLGTLIGSIMGAPQQPFGHAFAHVDDLRAYVDSVASTV